MNPYRVPSPPPAANTERTAFFPLAAATLLIAIILAPVLILVGGCTKQQAQTAESFAVKVAVDACDEAPAALQLPDPALIVLLCNQLGSLAEGAINPPAVDAAPPPPAVDAGAPPKVAVVVPRAFWTSLKAPAVDAGGT